MIGIEQVKLSEAQKKDAESRLKNWNALTRHIAEMDLNGIRRLLVYELDTRHRFTVLQRLVARFGVLEQQANEHEVARALAKRLG